MSRAVTALTATIGLLVPISDNDVLLDAIICTFYECSGCVITMLAYEPLHYFIILHALFMHVPAVFIILHIY